MQNIILWHVIWRIVSNKAQKIHAGDIEVLIKVQAQPDPKVPIALCSIVYPVISYIVIDTAISEIKRPDLRQIFLALKQG
jgi:hypothetical protein